MASLVSVITSFLVVGDQVLFTFDHNEGFNVSDTLFYVALGVMSGLVSVYFHKVHFAITGALERIRSRSNRFILGGVIMGVILYFIPPLYGEGYGVINALLSGNHLAVIQSSLLDYWSEKTYVVILLLLGITLFKSIAMTLTIASGGTGGIIIPALVMGSSLGNAVGKTFNALGFTVNETHFTLIGMAGIVAGVLKTPLTAIFLIAEITGGYELFVPLMLCVSTAYLISKNNLSHTIYTKELAEKNALLTFDKDQSILTLMKLDTVIEQNFIELSPEMSLRELLEEGVAKSSRNLFPVVNEDGSLEGIILLDDIRSVLFNQTLYDSSKAREYLTRPPEVIDYSTDSMQQVMQHFQNTGAWNLPVIRDGKYFGFVSKSKLLTAYRRELINYSV